MTDSEAAENNDLSITMREYLTEIYRLSEGARVFSGDAPDIHSEYVGTSALAPISSRSSIAASESNAVPMGANSLRFMAIPPCGAWRRVTWSISQTRIVPDKRTADHPSSYDEPGIGCQFT